MSEYVCSATTPARSDPRRFWSRREGRARGLMKSCTSRRRRALVLPPLDARSRSSGRSRNVHMHLLSLPFHSRQPVKERVFVPQSQVVRIVCVCARVVVMATATCSPSEQFSGWRQEQQPTSLPPAARSTRLRRRRRLAACAACIVLRESHLCRTSPPVLSHRQTQTHTYIFLLTSIRLVVSSTSIKSAFLEFYPLVLFCACSRLVLNPSSLIAKPSTSLKNREQQQFIMNPKRSHSSGGTTAEQVSLAEEEEDRSSTQVESRKLRSWKSRCLHVLSQMRESCRSEEKQKRRASYESVFGSDYGE